MILLIAAITYTAYTLARSLPEMVYIWLPHGDFGIRDADLTGRIKALAPHSAATDAGLHVGDVIDMKQVDLHQLNVAIGAGARPGEVWLVHVVSPGPARVVTLVARSAYNPQDSNRWVFWQQVYMVLSILIGLTVVLLKPGRLTWLFYLSWTSGGDVTNALMMLPGWLWVVAVLPATALFGAALGLLLMFCLVFPNDELVGWRKRVFPFAVGYAIVGAAWQVVLLFAFVMRTGIDPGRFAFVGTYFDIATRILTSAVLIAYYIEASERERKRVLLLIVAFVLDAVVVGVLYALWLLGMRPLPNLIILQYSGLLVTIVFAYFIIRRGMFDIEFVLSRGLVFSVLGLAGIALFIGVDIGFTALFHGSRAEVAVDIALALAIGFAARAVYGRLSDLVDRMLFKRRYEARSRLKVALNAVADAGSTRAIEEIVTSGAASALNLASAIFFRRVADGGYLREIGFGWPADAPWHLLPNDKLAAALENDAPSIDLRTLEWSRTSIAAPQQPVFAVPMRSGRRAVGVTLYGSRTDGVLPSPDDLGGLVELSQRSANPYLTLDSMRSAVAARELAAARVSR